MVEGLKAKGIDNAGAPPAVVSRSSTSPALPVRLEGHHVASQTGSPASSRPPPLRISQTFPVASHTSDLASSPSQPQDVQRPVVTRGFSGSPVARNSPSSSAFFETSAESSAIDPLSQHILKRTNTQKSIPLKLLGRASYEAEAGGTDSYNATEQGSNRGDAATHPKPSKDKKKGVSFLSRFIGNKKKELLSDVEDDATELETGRIDTGAAAPPIGFMPRFPPPPKYLKVRAPHKKERTFSRVFVAQELQGTATPSGQVHESVSEGSNEQPDSGKTGKAVWALEFSKDGRYLAAAGQDWRLRVWAVLSSPEGREEEVYGEGDETLDDHAPKQLKAPVFNSEPARVYEGHTASVLALSWSKNNFLLSSSMDKTVRLWHVTRSECLCCFKHSDFVTSIQFHPRDDRFFLAGSLDTKLRLWSIPDKSVAFMTTVPDMITAVAFTPDGRYSIAGCLNGLCTVYETDGMKPVNQINVRSARGRNAKGSKITGIDTLALSPDDPHSDVKLLITSNDSRIRMYNFKERTMETKFRGNENTSSQIRASFSDDGKHVICGSEDRRAYIWPTSPVDNKDSDKRSFEVLETQSAIVTAAIMAPTKTKQLLGLSDDPIYDLCNPPPVTLVSQTDPASTPKPGNGDQRVRTSMQGPRPSAVNKAAQESPTYMARSNHPGGNIIIVADYAGKIKVLRQDCAFQKRRHEYGDTGSISRRLLRRTNSARHSIASSIGKESSHKTPSERILSWRNSVVGHERYSVDGSRNGNRTPRSISPRRSGAANRYSNPVPALSANDRPDNQSLSTASPPQSPPYTKSSVDSRWSNTEVARQLASHASSARHPPLSSTTIVANENPKKDNPLWLQGEQSYAYWNKITHDALTAKSKVSASNMLSPDRIPSSRRRNLSNASALSSDYGSSNGDDNEVLQCENCRGTNFRAIKARNGKQRLICVRCHKPISQ
ncbi:hypothetical protein ASPZODRAFT_138103 [Penicilliopsis zonata CBS 506.65]|uniref:Anaphase-promoting complex subunit 4 WD40 domain-containing protein n=1 Tax=Penicilliopsis zonata CBS 506.65 TaxID=1073090 RepID=A0A1L9SUS8_9EURO|nr:hypothetical protein ASPZODRAFT_138103 [Penicilliopsis zonata CBS 506.65]OJJ50980.1 hypothetical protein ASPZODRAFT_138103 [Penicilliopsis zonata CBS 506.65]